MERLVIEGKHYLRGSLPVSGSKNTALPLMAASLLAEGTTTLRDIPNLLDVATFANVLRISGASVRFDEETHVMQVDATTIDHPEAPYDLVKKMRASFYMLGALLGRCGMARVSLPGGCSWGPRPVDLHLKGMEAFGADVTLDRGDVVATAPGGRLEGGTFRMEPSSVGTTINLMLAAVTARGTSRIANAACEPDVVVFGEALQQMGAHIDGLGTRDLVIEGVETLHPITFRNCPDRIELGTFMIAAAIAGAPGDTLRITNANPKQLGTAFLDAFERTGTRLTVGDDYVDVVPPEQIEPVSIETGVYPGFPTDLQAQWTVLLTQACGNARVVDTIYFDRFKHVAELRRMNATAIVIGNEVVVEGKNQLQGTKVTSTDLRASVSLVLAALVAEGETQVNEIYHLDRGYEGLAEKLGAAGIPIRRESYEEMTEPEALIAEQG